MVTEVVRGGRARDRQVTALPSGFTFDTWHHLAVEVRDNRLAVVLDELTVQERNLRRTAMGRGAVGVAVRGVDVSVDNVSVVPLYGPGRPPCRGAGRW